MSEKLNNEILKNEKFKKDNKKKKVIYTLISIFLIMFFIFLNIYILDIDNQENSNKKEKHLIEIPIEIQKKGFPRINICSATVFSRNNENYNVSLYAQVEDYYLITKGWFEIIQNNKTYNGFLELENGTFQPSQYDSKHAKAWIYNIEEKGFDLENESITIILYLQNEKGTISKAILTLFPNKFMTPGQFRVNQVLIYNLRFRTHNTVCIEFEYIDIEKYQLKGDYRIVDDNIILFENDTEVIDEYHFLNYENYKNFDINQTYTLIADIKIIETNEIKTEGFFELDISAFSYYDFFQ
jgi:hypothetical protein